MATVAHHIRSHYDPEADRARLEFETGQLDAEAISEANPGGVEEDEDPWITEKPFGVSARVLRPPKFVPATIEYDEWGLESKSLERREDRRVREGEGEEDVAGWYRSLARKTPVGTPRSSTPTLAAQMTPMKERQTSQPKEDTIKRDRNNWFISRALEASAAASASASTSTSGTASPSPSSSVSPSPAPRPRPTPTLADILARDPPPLPSEQKYTPPVWLAIGPSNKGFAMLQKSGWEEGEALGRASRHRSGLGYTGKGKGKGSELVGDEGEAEVVKREVIDITSVDDEVVDLTLSDSDEPDSDDPFSHPSNPPPQSLPSPQSLQPALTQTSTDLDHAPRALLTPLPTVLKADKLGIGLKPKTTGSGIYRAPLKRVTHSQAAVAAHVRAAEEQRRMKKLVGRGRRGFERVKRREEEGRRALLAYLNT